MYETYTLTNFIDAVQALLDDDATLYSDAVVTHAIRRALARINQVCPMYDDTTLTTESGVLEYTLDDFEGKAIHVLAVTLTSDEDDADPESEPFYFYRINGTTPALRLRVDYGAHDDYLTVRYSEPHTIDSLDNGASTSLPDWLAEILLTGAAGYAVQQRAGSRIEANNLDGDTPADLLNLAQVLLANFEAALSPFGREKPPAAAVQQSGWQLDDWTTV